MREDRVPADEAVDVEVGLAVSCEVDGAGHDVEVHEEGDDLGREEAVDVVQVQLSPGVVDLGVAALGLLPAQSRDRTERVRRWRCGEGPVTVRAGED